MQVWTKRLKMGIRIISRNKKATYEYEILEKFEAGLVLSGSEVKALRASRANLNDAYCRFVKGELFLMNAHISHLETTNRHFAPESRALRKLLLHKKELLKLHSRVQKESLAIIPLMLYFNEANRVKVSISLAKGKKLHDKREDLKRKTMMLEAKKAMKNRDYR